MRSLLTALLALPFLLPGCVDYQSQSGPADADGDAGAQADGDGSAVWADDGGEEDCERLINVVSGEAGPCIPPGVPCGFALDAMVCEDGSDCPAPGACWFGRCLQPDASAGGAGCVEARVELSYGGAAPDRIYGFELMLPTPQRGDGTAIDAAEDWFLFNSVPCTPLGNECYSYHRPVTTPWTLDEMWFQGASGFSLYKLRTSEIAAIGPGWLFDGRIRALWDFTWDFGLGGNEQAEWFQSQLSIRVWSNWDGCSSQATYLLSLVPDQADTIEAEPVVDIFCRD